VVERSIVFGRISRHHNTEEYNALICSFLYDDHTSSLPLRRFINFTPAGELHLEQQTIQ
jgi:hypothetical protein